jgi:hypothetical protein
MCIVMLSLHWPSILLGSLLDSKLHVSNVSRCGRYEVIDYINVNTC